MAARHGWHLTCAPGAASIPAGWKGDGAITLVGDSRLQRRIRGRCRTVVDVGLADLERPLPRTVVDNAAVARLAVGHFRERGFRRFACLSRPGLRMFDERAQAFASLLAEAGFTVTPIAMPDGEAGLKRLGRCLAGLAGPLALFAVQDSLGAAAILAALEAGLAVPEQVAVLGVDDVDLVCEALAVPLASVDSDQEGLGAAAAERLAGLLGGGPDEGDLRRWPPRAVVERRSAESIGTGHDGLRSALALARRDPGCGVLALAAAARLSPQGLDKACRRELGQSPGALLRRIRLETARHRLASGDRLAQAASAAGLPSASSLCALVHRQLGTTPATWRRQLRGGCR